MGLPLPGVSQSGKVAATTAPDSSNPITAGAIASVHEAGSNTTINSLADLKKKAPGLYKAMMEGIALNVCNDMEHHQDRLKKLMRESTAQPG